jgi:dTDP-4-amino-4,6-dideoxygalactose transaminase
MDAFRDLARQRGLKIVEDAAHAPGATWGSEPIGSIGDASCFSFFSNKNLVTGEGGMVTTNDDRIAAFIRANRSHGMTASTIDKHKGHAFTYDVVSLGYNYRIGEIQSALGLVQLSKLKKNNAKRRALVKRYHERLAGHPGLEIPYAGRQYESSCHLCPALLPEGASRETIQAAMKADGVQTSVHYPPVHRFTSFEKMAGEPIVRVEHVAERLITLPLHPLMSDDDVDRVCESLEKALP